MSMDEPRPYAEALPADRPPPPADEPPESDRAADAPLPPLRWKLNAVLFVATVAAVLLNGALYQIPEHDTLSQALRDAVRHLNTN
jgi:hypothetical protein